MVINLGNVDFLRENTGRYISLNGRIIETARYTAEENDGTYWDHGIAYEVIRVINRAPMFAGDHFSRLNASLSLLDGSAAADLKTLRGEMAALLEANGERDCNIKIWAAPDRASGVNRLMNINRSFYPPRDYYENGVPVGLYAYTRGNPNAKHVVSGFKERVQAIIDSGKVFELILYDEDGRMTEGSRSNLFFSRGGKLFTAPDHMILKGTIRKYVFDAAASAGIEVVERPLTLAELDPPGVDGAFITGTSIGVLPLARVGDIRINSTADPVVAAIRAEYEKIACV